MGPEAPGLIPWGAGVEGVEVVCIDVWYCECENVIVGRSCMSVCRCMYDRMLCECIYVCVCVCSCMHFLTIVT